VTAKAQKTVHVKWVRSGIAFPHQQKTMIRSLGFTHLNQVVERPDTAQIRGLVARLAHLVEIVEAPRRPAWADTPEYTIHPKPAAAVQSAASQEGSTPEPGEKGETEPGSAAQAEVTQAQATAGEAGTAAAEEGQ
jgi:large subunit ribosomal protein L30